MHARLCGAWVALVVAACDDSSGVQWLEPDVEAPAAVDFGVVYVSDVVVREIAVTSMGTGIARVLGAHEDDDALTVSYDASQAQLGGGGRLTLRITWRPTQDGAHAGIVRILTDVPGKEELTVLTSGFAQPLPSCDDGNPCTDEYFDRATESCRYAFNTSPCDDGSACTTEDRCYEGICRAVARTCDDDNPCTFNLCDPARGCIFPEGALRCDDGDPCTADVCDKDDGCTFPDAENGTPCGSFSCAEAHVCILGECMEFDISGQSDGFPCSDGDPCTVGDRCYAGECESGPAREDPVLTATLPIYGMGGGAATDGLRYAFLHEGALTLASIDVNGDLVPASQRALTGEHLVKRAAGSFLALTRDSLVLIDAIDAASPVLTARALAHSQAPEHDSVTLTDGEALIAMQGGAVVQATLVYHGGEGETRAPGVFFAPHDPTLPLVRLSDSADVTHVAAGHDAVAWSTPQGIAWRRLSTHGELLEALDMPARPAVRAMSVLGREFALLEDDKVELVRVAPAASNPPSDCLDCELLLPGCGATPLPDPGAYATCAAGEACGPGRLCQQVSVADCDEAGCEFSECDVVAHVCLSTLRPFVADERVLDVPGDTLDLLRWQDSLVLASPMKGLLRVHDAAPEDLVPLDALGATRVWAAEQGVFFEAVRGIVLPRVWSEAAGAYVRVTGAGLGGLRGASVLGPGARIAGNATRATLRVDDDAAFLSWTVSNDAPDQSPGFVLIRGDGRPDLITMGGGSVPIDSCESGLAWTLRELSTPSVNRTLCAPSDVAPKAYVAERVVGVSAAGDVVTWNLVLPDPVAPVSLTPPEAGADVWGAREGTVLALLHETGAVTFFDGDLDVWHAVGHWPYDAARQPLAYARTQLIVLNDDLDALELFDVASASSAPVASVPLPSGWTQRQVHAMERAQAWLTARDDDAPDDVVVQLRYDAGANELYAMGQFSWPLVADASLARVVDAFALLNRVIVVRGNEVGVVEPACQ